MTSSDDVSLTRLEPGCDAPSVEVPCAAFRAEPFVPLTSDRRPLSEKLLWLRALVTAPRTIASIAPSSQALADAVVSRLDLGDSPHVLELGPGTGALTRALLRRGLNPGRYVGIEVRAELVEGLRTAFPDLSFVHGSALGLSELLRAADVEPTRVVASLPWSILSRVDRKACLEAAAQAIGPAGQLVTYSYVSGGIFLPARRLDREFPRVFDDVETHGVVWRNLPPAMVWSCRR
ncbi:MAG: methyltransferase domain-containing protein [Thermoanaerobaculia bacterium]|nr:methyltransferase domain-containing protein [Thermoanaerobaculia bacterium]